MSPPGLIARRARGSSVVEAMVAAALAGIAIAGLAGVARLATNSLRMARNTSTALALASERLEALRAGPRAAGNDSRVAPDGTRFEVAWNVAGGRGEPAALSVRVDWLRHAVTLSTEALP
jgi:Tfp pilus assembly protein PilV